MRTIKFRVWDKKRKAFLLPYPTLDVKQIQMGEDTRIPTFLLGGNGDLVLYSYTGGMSYPVYNKENYIIQQFTGLKDRNGKDIYEGDILDRGDMYAYHMVVEWKDGYWSPIVTSNSSGLVVMTGIYMKIIGNIYENPELLK